MKKIKEIKIVNQDESTEVANIGADAINVDYNNTTVKDELDKLNATDNSLVNTQANQENILNSLQSQVAGLASGSPLVASSVSEMIDTTKTYVNTTDGYWYYYNGSDWIQGGIYQALIIGDNSVGYEALKEEIKSDLTTNFTIVNTYGKSGYYYGSAGHEIQGDNESKYATYSLQVKPYEIYKISVTMSTTFIQGSYPAYMLKENDTLRKRVNISEITIEDGVWTEIIQIPEHVNLLQFQMTYPRRGYIIKVDSYKVSNISKNQLDNKLQSVFSETYEEINPTLLIPNCYFKGKGVNFEAYNSSDVYYVDVMPGEKFKISARQIWIRPILGFCTNNLKLNPTVSGETYEVFPILEIIQNAEVSEYLWNNYEFTVPEYCNRIYVQHVKNDNTFSLKKHISYKISQDSIDIGNFENPLNDKKIAFLGDSITAASTTGYKGWPVLIQENNPSAMIYNIAHDGATITDNGASYSIYNQIQNLYNTYPDTDYIIIEGGVNDLWTGVELGSFIENDNFNGDTPYDTTTFSGALEWIFHYCYENFPGKKIGYIVTQKVTGTNGFYNFMNRAKEICAKWSIPYLDLYNESNLNFYITSQRRNYSKNTTSAAGDGCHPNLAGYKIITPKIENWLKYTL